MHLGNTGIFRSQQGVISDSPITSFERVGEVSRFSFFINSKFGSTLHRHRTPETISYWGLCHALPNNEKCNKDENNKDISHRNIDANEVSTLGNKDANDASKVGNKDANYVSTVGKEDTKEGYVEAK